MDRVDPHAGEERGGRAAGARAAFGLLLLFLATVPSRAEVLEVPSLSFPTIQAALDAAFDGDEIRVAAGVYSGPGNRDLDFRGLSVVLRSESGPAATVLDCEGSPFSPHRAILFDDGETRATIVEGFTFLNGHAPGEGEAIRGGAILCRNGSSPTIRDCVVRRGFAWRGGGVFCDQGSDPLLEDCVFLENHVVLNGGAISCAGGSPEVLRCRLEGNSSEKHAAALGCLVGADATVTDCVIVDNEAAEDGTVFVDRSSVRLTGIAIVGNRARRGAGLFLQDTGAVEAENVTIAANRATFAGGAVFLREVAQLDLRRCLIWAGCGPEVEDEIHLVDAAAVRLDCSRYDPDHVVIEGSAGLEELGPQVTEDPLLCGVLECGAPPGSEGALGLDARSPCAPERSPCGERIGAFPVLCGDPVVVRGTSWGRLKGRYRRP